MALIICSECGKEISSFAEKCPYCGISININNKEYKLFKKPRMILLLAIFSCIGLFVANQIYQNKLEKERTLIQQEADAEELNRIEISYEGALIYTCAMMKYGTVVHETTLSYINAMWSVLIQGGYTDINNEMLKFYESTGMKNILEITKEIDETLVNSMIDIQSPPDKYKDAYYISLDMYELYIQLSNQVKNPTGSYSTFNSTNVQTVSKFNSLYAKIEVMLPNIEEEVKKIENEFSGY